MSSKMLVLIVILLLLLFVFIAPLTAEAVSAVEAREDISLNMELKDGEAAIWYLDHSGWGIKTRRHFLVFDYIEAGNKPTQPGLENGFINPTELQAVPVTVFISHAHGDHFDEVILDWEKALNDITYIFGWNAFDAEKYHYISHPRAKKKFEGMEVLTVNHDFDGIPEAAFLVKVDGLVVFHSGDHGNTGEELNPHFKDNIDYLADQVERVDIAFISMFGSRTGEAVNSGDLYTIAKLQPKVTFPMHKGGGEGYYLAFADEARKMGAETRILCVETRGDAFFFGRGDKG